MNEREAALAILEPLRENPRLAGWVDALDWQALTHESVALSHSQDALVQIAHAVWSGGKFATRVLGMLDKQNRARVLVTLQAWLDVDATTLIDTRIVMEAEHSRALD